MTPVLVIGVGNAFRGDDAAGLEVARRLRSRAPRGAVVQECEGSASSLLQAWQGCARVVLVDAASGGGRPGSIRRFEAHRRRLPAGWLHASTHSWGVAEAVEIARSLGELPPELVVYAIEGTSFVAGSSLSPPVQQAVLRVERMVLDEIGRVGPSPSGPPGAGPWPSRAARA